MGYEDFRRRVGSGVPGYKPPALTTIPGTEYTGYIDYPDQQILNNIEQTQQQAVAAQQAALPPPPEQSGGFLDAITKPIEYVSGGDWWDDVEAAAANLNDNKLSPSAWLGLPMTLAAGVEAPLQIPANIAKEAMGDFLYMSATRDFKGLGLFLSPLTVPLAPAFFAMGMLMTDETRQGIIDAHENAGYSNRSSGAGVWEYMQGHMDGMPAPLRYPLRIAIELVSDPLTWTGVGAARNATKIGRLGQIGRSAEEYNALSRTGKVGAQIRDIPQAPLQGLDAAARSLGVVSDTMFVGAPVAAARGVINKTPARWLGETSESSLQAEAFRKDTDRIGKVASAVSSGLTEVPTPMIVDKNGNMIPSQERYSGPWNNSPMLDIIANRDPRSGRAPTVPVGEVLPGAETFRIVKPNGTTANRFVITDSTTNIEYRIDEMLNGDWNVSTSARPDVTFRDPDDAFMYVEMLRSKQPQKPGAGPATPGPGQPGPQGPAGSGPQTPQGPLMGPGVGPATPQPGAGPGPGGTGQPGTGMGPGPGNIDPLIGGAGPGAGPGQGTTTPNPDEIFSADPPIDPSKYLPPVDEQPPVDQGDVDLGYPDEPDTFDEKGKSEPEDPVDKEPEAKKPPVVEAERMKPGEPNEEPAPDAPKGPRNVNPPIIPEMAGVHPQFQSYKGASKAIDRVYEKSAAAKAAGQADPYALFWREYAASVQPYGQMIDQGEAAWKELDASNVLTDEQRAAITARNKKATAAAKAAGTKPVLEELPRKQAIWEKLPGSKKGSKKVPMHLEPKAYGKAMAAFEVERLADKHGTPLPAAPYTVTEGSKLIREAKRLKHDLRLDVELSEEANKAITKDAPKMLEEALLTTDQQHANYLLEALHQVKGGRVHMVAPEDAAKLVPRDYLSASALAEGSSDYKNIAYRVRERIEDENLPVDLWDLVYLSRKRIERARKLYVNRQPFVRQKQAPGFMSRGGVPPRNNPQSWESGPFYMRGRPSEMGEGFFEPDRGTPSYPDDPRLRRTENQRNNDLIDPPEWPGYRQARGTIEGVRWAVEDAPLEIKNHQEFPSVERAVDIMTGSYYRKDRKTVVDQWAILSELSAIMEKDTGLSLFSDILERVEERGDAIRAVGDRIGWNVPSGNMGATLAREGIFDDPTGRKQRLAPYNMRRKPSEMGEGLTPETPVVTPAAPAAPQYDPETLQAHKDVHTKLLSSLTPSKNPTQLDEVLYGEYDYPYSFYDKIGVRAAELSREGNGQLSYLYQKLFDLYGQVPYTGLGRSKAHVQLKKDLNRTASEIRAIESSITPPAPPAPTPDMSLPDYEVGGDPALTEDFMTSDFAKYMEMTPEQQDAFNEARIDEDIRKRDEATYGTGRQMIRGLDEEFMAGFSADDPEMVEEFMSMIERMRAAPRGSLDKQLRAELTSAYNAARTVKNNLDDSGDPDGGYEGNASSPSDKLLDAVESLNQEIDIQAQNVGQGNTKYKVPPDGFGLWQDEVDSVADEDPVVSALPDEAPVAEPAAVAPAIPIDDYLIQTIGGHTVGSRVGAMRDAGDWDKAKEYIRGWSWIGTMLADNEELVPNKADRAMFAWIAKRFNTRGGGRGLTLGESLSSEGNWTTAALLANSIDDELSKLSAERRRRLNKAITESRSVYDLHKAKDDAWPQADIDKVAQLYGEPEVTAAPTATEQAAPVTADEAATDPDRDFAAMEAAAMAEYAAASKPRVAYTRSKFKPLLSIPEYQDADVSKELSALQQEALRLLPMTGLIPEATDINRGGVHQPFAVELKEIERHASKINNVINDSKPNIALINARVDLINDLFEKVSRAEIDIDAARERGVLDPLYEQHVQREGQAPAILDDVVDDGVPEEIAPTTESEAVDMIADAQAAQEEAKPKKRGRPKKKEETSPIDDKSKTLPDPNDPMVKDEWFEEKKQQTQQSAKKPIPAAYKAAPAKKAAAAAATPAAGTPAGGGAAPPAGGGAAPPGGGAPPAGGAAPPPPPPVGWEGTNRPWDVVDRLFMAQIIDEDTRTLMNEVITVTGIPGAKKKKQQMKVADYLLLQFQLKGGDYPNATRAAEAATVKALYDHRLANKQLGAGKLPLPKNFRRGVNAYLAATNNIRTRIMLNPYTGGMIGGLNAVGNSVNQLIEGNFDLARDQLRPSYLKAAYRAVQKGHLADMNNTPSGKFFDDWGADVTRDVSINLPREGEVGKHGLGMDRAIAKWTNNSEVAGRRLKRVLAAGGVRGSEFMYNLQAGIELNGRMSTAAKHAEEVGLKPRLDKFFKQVKGFKTTTGDATALLGDLTTGDPFDPDKIRALALKHGFTPDEAVNLGQTWKGHADSMAAEGIEKANDILFSYRYTNADELMRNVFMFHYWYMRASARYSRAIIKNPYLMVNYQRSIEALERESEGEPTAVKGMLKAFSAPGGYLIWMDPTKAIATAATFHRQAVEDGDEKSFDSFMGQSGMFLNPMLQAAAAVLGFSENRGIDPTGSGPVRRVLGAGVNAVASEFGATYPGTPFQDAVGEATEQLSDWVSKLTPADGPNQYQSSDTSNRVMIRNAILDAVIEKHGIEPQTPLAQWSREAVNELELELSNFDSGVPSEITDKAYREWSRAKLLQTMTAAFVPVGTSLRSETRDERLNINRGEAYDNTPAEGELQITQSAPEAMPLTLRNEQFSSMFPSGELGRVDVSPDTGLTQDQALAMPEMAPMRSFKLWQKQARELGEAEFMAYMMQTSPAYRQYIEQIPAEYRADPERFASMAVGYQAFLAANGKRSSMYDPNPLPASTPSAVDPAMQLFAWMQQNGYTNDEYRPYESFYRR